MSLLGFDAIGRHALGQLPDRKKLILNVTTANYAVTANGVSTGITANISPGAFVVAPQGVTLQELEAVSVGTFWLSTSAVSFKLIETVSAAAYVVSGQPTLEQANEVVQPASFAIAFSDVPLTWTGYSYEPPHGGVGHFLMEVEQAKQLAAITKRIVPPPIDTRSAPRFEPLTNPQGAPLAPVVDMPGILQQRMDGQAQAAQAAKKRQRDIEAILLLAA